MADASDNGRHTLTNEPTGGGRIDSRWILIIIIVLLAVISGIQLCKMVAGNEETITGCENQDGTWHCWNNGSIAKDTYFKITDDGLQLANFPHAFNWTTYTAGFNYSNDTGEQQSIGLFDFSYSERVRSNNLTWWIAEYMANFSYGNKAGNLTVQIGQYLNDDLVTYRIILNTDDSIAWDNWNKSVSFWRKMSRIDINDDGKNDYVKSEVNNRTYRIYLNRTNNLTDYQLTGNTIGIYDNMTNRQIEWGWNGNNEYHASLIAHPGSNADVLFWREPVEIHRNSSYRLDHYWIDDSYSLGYTGARSGYIHYEPTSPTPYVAYTDVNPKIGKKVAGIFSLEDRGYYSFNVTGVKQPDWSIYKVTFGHYVLTVASSAGLSNWITRFYNNFTYGTLVGGTADWNAGMLVDTEDWPGSPGSPQDIEIDLGQGAINRINAGLAFDDVKISDYSTYTGNPEYYHVVWKGKLFIYYYGLSVALSNPAKYTILNDSKNWDVYMCNWTGAAPDNISLYINGTLNYTNTGTSNLSRNVSFNKGEWFDWTNWDCKICGNHTCYWSTNGNYTFAFHNQTILTIRPKNNSIYTANVPFPVSCNSTEWQAYFTMLYVNGSVNKTIYYENLTTNLSLPAGIYSLTCIGYYLSFWPPGQYVIAQNQPVKIIIVPSTVITIPFLEDDDDDEILFILIAGIAMLFFGGSGIKIYRDKRKYKKKMIQ